MPRTPAALKLMQKDWPKLKARVDYRMKPCLKQNKEIIKKKKFNCNRILIWQHTNFIWYYI